jgi:hypothetical protein
MLNSMESKPKKTFTIETYGCQMAALDDNGKDSESNP